MDRKLAVILAADAVGYSRLMGDDEEATLATLQAHRKVIDGLIAEHRGRVFGGAGDSLIAEFASAVEAVRCAAAIQRQLALRNAELSEERRLHFRIGVNLGDVMVAGDDLMGDGVNVAARLESLAEAGGICVSEAVRQLVQDKLELGFEFLGEQRVKNIVRPLRAYLARPDPADSAAGVTGPAAAAHRNALAVLPFENMSGDAEQEYFADGIAEDLITALSKIAQLFVIARNSSFTYKGRPVKVQEVARELGVRYVVEGSVRKAGNRVRITAQLIDATSGGHLWAERYDRELTDIFAVQDEVTQEIVSALALKLTADERRRVAHKGTDNLEAYDCFLRGREQWWRHTREANAQAQALLARAVALDPNFSSAHALLSFTHGNDAANQWGESVEKSRKLERELAQRAVALDDSDPLAHGALGTALLWSRRHEAAIAEAQRCLALDPSFAFGHVLLGWSLHYSGRQEEAIEQLHLAMKLDPYYPDIYLHFLAQAYFLSGRTDRAVDTLKRRLTRNPESDISHVLLAACYGDQGRLQESRAAWAEAFRINPDYSLAHRRQSLPFKDPADFERIAEGLRRAGLVA